MENTKVKFKVAMDAEQAKLDNYEEVEIEVEFPEECLDQLKADALKTQIIKWQGQIRSNWNTFKENGVKEKMVYGDPLYASRRRTVVRAMTEQEKQDTVAKLITKLTPLGVQLLATTGAFPSEDNEDAWK